MPSQLDQIIIIDIEATCWEKQPPPHQESEIIEIGICTFDITTAKPLTKDSILVKPERSQVSEFCTQLTTLTQTQVDQGIPFTDACAILKDKYLSHKRVWASYGEYDKNQFQKQCQYLHIPYPFSPNHLNIKTLFAIFQALPKPTGMAGALEILNLPLEGTHHRGGDDAWNIARIFSHIILSARK
ncbi:MAG: 3'-5' exonuclease [Oscillatoriaceae cyanobacterium]